MRRSLAALALAAVALGAAGCSGDDESLPPKPDLSTLPAEPLWNPCTALDKPQVDELFGETFNLQSGTATEPLCTFTPGTDGGVVVNVTYQLYGGTIKDIVDQLPAAGDGASLTAPSLPGANGARIITSIEDDTLAVTGLVRNGRLIQLVNAVDPSPYDKPATVRGVRELMVQLAKHADESGLNQGGSSGG